MNTNSREHIWLHSSARVKVIHKENIDWNVEILLGHLDNLQVLVSNSSDMSHPAKSCGHVEQIAVSGRADVLCHTSMVAQYVTVQHVNKLSRSINISICETVIVGYIHRGKKKELVSEHDVVTKMISLYLLHAFTQIISLF